MIKHVVASVLFTLISGISLIATSCIPPPSFSHPTFTYDDIRARVGYPIAISPIRENFSSNATYTYNINPNLPEGLSIDSGSGTISGTPTTPHLPTTHAITAANNFDSTITSTATLHILIQIRPTTKAKLQDAIRNEITRQGTNSPDLITINTSPTSPTSTSQITDMSALFKDNTTFNGDISTWDVSNVKNMANMFNGATVFNQDISGWDVRQVTNMGFMFDKTQAFNQDISAWDVRQVTNMTHMFFEAPAFNQNLEAWGEHLNEQVKTTYMFWGSGVKKANNNIPSWLALSSSFTYNNNNITAIIGNSIKSVAQPPPLPNGATLTYSITPALPSGLTIHKSNGTISGTPKTPHLPTTHAITARNDYIEYTATIRIFIQIQPKNKGALKTAIRNEITRQGTNSPDLITINTSQITNMGRLFQSLPPSNAGLNNPDFNGDISTWDVSNVTDMNSMFTNVTAFNQDISKWNVSNVTNMVSMFYGAKAFNQDISGWNVSGVGRKLGTGMSGMFQKASAFNQNLNDWAEHLNGRTVETARMFRESGLSEENKPSWCNTSCY